jgi:two-component sensor histidine kinase
MASLAEIARSYTRVEGSALAHLQRLIAAWGLLADFCFSDLLVYAPVAGSDSKFVILGQMRPTTSQTLYRQDQVGRVIDEVERPLVARAWRLGQIVDGENQIDPQRERSRIQCIPVRWKDAMVGVMTRESVPSVGRRPGELERVYIEIFDRFARMIASGEFPFGAEDIETEDAPRVGDGVLLLDEFARVEYASPNAVSALHRIGVHSNLEGARLTDLGLDESPVRVAFAIGLPITEEMERGPVTLIVRAIPLIEHPRLSGAVVLLRDVSELRRRDRLLISKDATIREVHHRVKNNLQTISALLRLQGRRLESQEAIAAIEESVRRIRSIALVHETLSRASGDEVEFNAIVRPLARMVEEGLLSPEHPVRITVEGDAGELRAEVGRAGRSAGACHHRSRGGHPGAHRARQRRRASHRLLRRRRHQSRPHHREGARHHRARRHHRHAHRRRHPRRAPHPRPPARRLLAPPPRSGRGSGCPGDRLRARNGRG